jgi:hypothetical protein
VGYWLYEHGSEDCRLDQEDKTRQELIGACNTIAFYEMLADPRGIFATPGTCSLFSYLMYFD